MITIPNDVFDIFANTTAEIAVKGDYDDYEGTYTKITKGSVMGDLQPYSGALLERDYGLKKECQKRFFCKTNPDIKEGVYLITEDLITEDATFEVVYVEQWEDGMTVMLKEVRVQW